MSSTSADAADLTIVYDGDCPFCSRYVRLLRLRESAGSVALVNARDGGPAVDRLLRAGYDLNQGMVAEMAGRVYQGADCIHFLALMSTGSGLFNHVNAVVFRHPRLAAVLYPVLRCGRNLALALLGRGKLPVSA
jgi:predicted DCC family thiol-disulfide oxidoreductase YuxK